MYRYWILTLIIVARTSCEEYDQDMPDEYSDEDDSESSSHQDDKYAPTRNNANYTEDDLRGKIKRLLNKTIIQESDENNDVSRNLKTDNGNILYLSLLFNITVAFDIHVRVVKTGFNGTFKHDINFKIVDG